MKTVSVTAYFDGERILLDEALELEPDTKLIATILPKQDFERDVWQSLAKRGLAGAYADDEEGYSLNDVKVVNNTAPCANSNSVMPGTSSVGDSPVVSARDMTETERRRYEKR